jgi:hypothetical protein
MVAFDLKALRLDAERIAALDAESGEPLAVEGGTCLWAWDRKAVVWCCLASVLESRLYERIDEAGSREGTILGDLTQPIKAGVVDGVPRRRPAVLLRRASRNAEALVPGLSFLFCLGIWVGLSKPAKIAGGLWLGLLHLAYQTRGFRKAPVLMDFSES